MDMPRGPLPLTESDFLDFIYNYFKAEYAPIRWIFASTADAVPRQPQRWNSMVNELFPTAWHPASPQTQADLVRQAVAERWTREAFESALDAQAARTRPAHA